MMCPSTKILVSNSFQIERTKAFGEMANPMSETAQHKMSPGRAPGPECTDQKMTGQGTNLKGAPPGQN